jgi:hypothetical protein
MLLCFVFPIELQMRIAVQLFWMLMFVTLCSAAWHPRQMAVIFILMHLGCFVLFACAPAPFRTSHCVCARAIGTKIFVYAFGCCSKYMYSF